jgi:GSH-dependent disulfide-bond oxidoreductase
MIDLYYSDSGNSMRAVMALEECGFAYRQHRLDLQRGDHEAPEYLKLNPFGLVPLMVDDGGPGCQPITLAQSGAILLYAAERSRRFLPADPALRYQAMQWCLMAVSDAAPANAIINYMNHNVPDLSQTGRDYLMGRFVRLMRGVEAQLASSGQDYLTGELSIADLALFPVVRMRRTMLEEIGDLPYLLRWADRLAARPAVLRAAQAMQP